MNVVEGYEKHLKEFREKYSDVPGIISIEDDNWDGSTFVVIADFSKFDKDSIPQTYGWADIFIIDVYRERDAMEEVLQNLRAQNPDLKDDALGFFVQRVEAMNKLIRSYEEKK